MKKMFALLLLTFVMGISCGPQPGPKTVIEEDFHVPGPPPPVLPTAQCAPACNHLKKLGCAAGNDFRDGTTCEQFCKETIENGIWLDPDCVAQVQIVTAPECPEIEHCAIRQERTRLDMGTKTITIIQGSAGSGDVGNE